MGKRRGGREGSVDEWNRKDEDDLVEKKEENLEEID